MTLLFCDGFDTGDAASKWGGLGVVGTVLSPSFVTNTPYSSGKAISFPILAQSQFLRLTQSLPNLSTVHLGFALNVQSVPPGTAPSQLLKLSGDGGTTDHVILSLQPNGQLVWARGSVGTTLGALTVVPTINRWYYIEARISLGDTGGEIVCRVDGNADLNLTSIDTKNAGTLPYFDTLVIGNGGGTGGNSGSHYFDDVYVCDTTGTRNNTFLGPIRVQTLSPNAAGADSGLTPLSGSNYQNVSDQNSATYNFSATIGTRDTYALPDLATGTTSVLAVRNVVTGQNSDAGGGGFKPVVRSGGTNYYDPTVTVGASNRVYSQAVRETDPATSAPWTVPNVNALQVGAEVS